ncbi:MAG: polyhydroxybutyrate depolymerase [Acidimicrobiia bacterium]|nr:polyhydroxybutyrate depolymerase [Acidimicrobiia bacterium]
MNRRVFLVAALTLVLVLVQSGCRRDRDGAEPPSSGSDVESVTLAVDGRNREYRVFTPASAVGERDLAAVLVLHGGAGSIEGTVEQTGFDEVAAEEGFLAVYPQGNETRLSLGDLTGYTWKAGGCCGEGASDADDVSFLVAVIDDLVAINGVDPNQVYVTGISNGGMMAYRLACDASESVAAIAPVSATLFTTDCAPSAPVSLLHIHGLEDDNVLFEGGRNRKGLVKQDRPPVLDGIDTFLAANDCSSEVSVTDGEAVVAETWSDCAADSAVELVTIASGGHSWPGGEAVGAISR